MSFKSELNRVMNQITELYNTESEKNSDIESNILIDFKINNKSKFKKSIDL